EITPSDQRIVIEARANPNDRAHLRRGLPARVRVGAYDYATYGTFEGRVTEVSADTLKDERENRYYRVNIEVDLTDLAERDNPPGVLMPGMGASADIAVGKRTILSYLLSPLLRFRDGAFRAS
ncbi:MAG: HlyD family type I secretion periplasmic adaptor subunit, partial [Desulfuromonas sp.]